MTTETRQIQQTQMMIPGLSSLYQKLEGLSWLMLRVGAGLLLVPHGAQKLFGVFGGGGLDGTAGFFESVGYPAPYLLALAVGILEFFGGLLLAVGLFTRPVALAVMIFMAFAVSFHTGNGFFWTARGYEYPLLWGLVAFFFAINGAGAYSLDRKIGREF